MMHAICHCCNFVTNYNDSLIFLKLFPVLFEILTYPVDTRCRFNVNTTYDVLYLLGGKMSTTAAK